MPGQLITTNVQHSLNRKIPVCELSPSLYNITLYLEPTTTKENTHRPVNVTYSGRKISFGVGVTHEESRKSSTSSSSSSECGDIIHGNRLTLSIDEELSPPVSTRKQSKRTKDNNTQSPTNEMKHVDSTV